MLFTIDGDGQLRWRPRRDKPQWNSRLAGKPAGYTNTYGRQYVIFDGHTYPTRRVVAALTNGAWPTPPKPNPA